MDDETYLEDYYPFLNNPSSVVYNVLRNEPARAQLNFRNPLSTSIRYNYYVRMGQSVGDDWRNEIVQIVKKARSAGKHTVGIRFSDSAVLDAALDTMNSSGLLMFGLLYFRMQAEPIWGTNVLYIWW